MPSANAARYSAIPLAIGLLAGCGLVYLKIEARRADEAKERARLAEQGRFADEYLRKQALPPGLSEREAETTRAVAAAMLFLGQVRDGDAAGAYGSAAESYRQRVSPAAFEELLRSHPEVREQDRCLTTVTISHGDRVRRMQLGSAPAGAPLVNVTVERQGNWVVTDFTIRPPAGDAPPAEPQKP